MPLPSRSVSLGWLKGEISSLTNTGSRGTSTSSISSGEANQKHRRYSVVNLGGLSRILWLVATSPWCLWCKTGEIRCNCAAYSPIEPLRSHHPSRSSHRWKMGSGINSRQKKPGRCSRRRDYSTLNLACAEEAGID